MPALREIYASYGVEFDKERNLQRGNRQVDRLRSRLGRLSAVAGRVRGAMGGLTAVVGGGAAAIGGMVTSTVRAERELGLWSERLNIGSRSLRTWIELGREYGASIDDVTDALKELQLKAQDAISGGTEQAEMFERIGISIDDLRPIVSDTDELMGLFTRRLNENTTAAMRNFTVDEIMSDAGTRMMGVFKLGAEAIDRRREAIERQLSPEQDLTAQVQESASTVARLSREYRRFKRELTALLMPALQRVTQVLGEMTPTIRRVIPAVTEIIENTNLLEGALYGLAAAAAVLAIATIELWGPMALAAGAAAAVVAGVAVAYDQVTRSINGSETALSEYLDAEERLGEGGTRGVLLLLSDAWERLTSRLQTAWGWLESVRETLNSIGGLFDAGIGQVLSMIPGGEVIRSGLAESGMDILGRAARARTAEEERREAASVEARNQQLQRWENETLPAGGGPALDVFGRPISLAPAERPSLIREREQRIEQNVDARSDISVTVNEAEDGEEAYRRVRREVEEAQADMIRQMQGVTHQPEED